MFMLNYPTYKNASDFTISSWLSIKVAQTTLRTVDNLKKAVDYVEQSSDMLLQIASAAEQQSSVAGEINENIHSINTMSTENEQAIGYIARASEELANLSEQLNQVTKKFQS